jgi:hypothetical protein
MLARLGLVALAASGSPSGCDQVFGDGRQNAHHPGTDLGTFQVTGSSIANTCGEGALGEQQTWPFTVKLARDTSNVFWDNGQAVIAGALASDGVSFSFDSGVVMDMRPPENTGLPPCSLSRTDHAAGTLGSTGTDVTSFSGQLTYQFSPTAGSRCDDVVSGPTALVATLPCGFGYQLTAQRTVAPQ